MPDAGTIAADKAQKELESRIGFIYGKARKDVSAKLKAHTAAFKAKDKQKRAQLKAGLISKQDYADWKQGQVFTGKMWQDKLNSIEYTLLHAAEQVNDIVEGQKLAIFGENATFMAFELSKDYGLATSFNVYDAATVTRLVKEKPELLPRREVNGVKQKAWERSKISNRIAIGIVSGASIDEIAQSIADATALTDEKAAVRYARTAMTSAQNSGRIAAMQDAQSIGINVEKLWIATLDAHTRDAHAHLDGQTAKVNEPFISKLGEIDYPGDPFAKPANTYNCRCTLGWNYPEYKRYGQRRDNETKQVIADMTYDEWKAAKTNGKLADFSTAKNNLIQKQKEVALSDADHVFKGIWKNDVTYADWEARKGSIDAKRDYYNDAIDRAEMRGDTAKADEYRALLAELEKFEKNGAKNYQLLKERDAALQNVKAIQNSFITQQPQAGQFAPDAWSDAAKQAALRFNTRDEADKYYRPILDQQWDGVSNEGKYAIWEYTRNSHPINKSLSGYHDDWPRQYFVGYENAVWGHEDRWRDLPPGDMSQFAVDGHADYKNAIVNLTKTIDNVSLKDAASLVRGSSVEGLAGLMEGGGMDFNQSVQLFKGGHSVEEIRQQLIGQRVKNNAFTSTAIAADSGFNDEVKYHIYCPKGTKGIYAEPQSYWGFTSGKNDGNHFYKKGESYSIVGGEAEIILQRGTTYRITDIRLEHQGWKDVWVVDMDVVEQPDYFKFGDEDTFNNGATRHAR